jgi:hypothetical protein
MKVEGYIITNEEAERLENGFRMIGAVLRALNIHPPVAPVVSKHPALIEEATLAAARKPAKKVARKTASPAKPAAAALPAGDKGDGQGGKVTVVDRICGWLKNGPMKTRELIAMLAVDVKSFKNPAQVVYSSLNWMKRQGRVEKQGGGVWALKAVRPQSGEMAEGAESAKAKRLGLIARLDRSIREKDPVEAMRERATRVAAEEG